MSEIRALIHDIETKFNRYELQHHIYSTFIVKFYLYDHNHNICVKFSIDTRHKTFSKVVEYVEQSLYYRQNAHNYIMQNLILFERTTENKYQNGKYRLHINDNHIFIKTDTIAIECQPEEIIQHFPELVLLQNTNNVY